MNREPWARLMTFMIPRTSVSPDAIRKSSTPSCTPFSVCSRSSRPLIARGLVRTSRSVLKLAVLGICIDGIGREPRRRLGDQLALLILDDLSKLVVLDGKVVH